MERVLFGMIFAALQKVVATVAEKFNISDLFSSERLRG